MTNLIEGVLSPRQTGEFVADGRNPNVKCNEDGVIKAANMIVEAMRNGEIVQVDFDAYELHPKSGREDSIDWVFFMDVINFSFWSEKGNPFHVTYKGKKYSGYFAGCAAVNRALDNGIPITSASFMATVDEETLEEIFKSDVGGTIPMIPERVKAINDAGKVLLDKFNGTFYKAVEECNKSAESLLNTIVKYFQSFHDFAIYDGKKVSLLKRAQILVADVYGCLKNKNEIGNFYDIEVLTMFADYRVPQVCAYLGALQYSDYLMEKLKSKDLFKNGESLEVELRAMSVYCCDQITQHVQKILNKEKNLDSFKSVRKVTAMDVDIFLWVYRRKHSEEIEKAIPFHRVRCIYY
uniref:Queuosine 5'-phosphate N-glycosylase/hydrolase n=1 Tax=Strongyloides venezuelensis TaxID=75913 RepID=A0A0K0G2H2_STRVS